MPPNAPDHDGPTGRFSLRRAVARRLSAGAKRVVERARARTLPALPVEVRFEVAAAGTEGLVTGQVATGTTLLAAAAALGVDLDHYCGGNCSCGTCRIEIVSGAEHLSRQDGRERMVLGRAHTMAGDRLACQARVLGPVHVRVPRWF